MGLRAKFLGALGTVTGSCHMLHDTRTDRYYLVDCGSFQGIGSRQLAEARFIDGRIGGVECSRISAVFLTHAHADHSGMLPHLVLNGFRGPIFCTEFTKWATLSTLYDMAQFPGAGYEQDVVIKVQTLMRSVDEDEKYCPFVLGWTRKVNPKEDHFGFNFTRTSHLMGCVAIEFIYNDQPEGTSTKDNERIRILFGADTGNIWDAATQGSLVKDVQPPSPETQTIVLESTYGGRVRETLSFRERIERLADELESAAKEKASPVIVIPTFAIQRTQEIILDLASVLHFIPERVPSLIKEGKPPVIVSSSRMANGIGGLIRAEFFRLNGKNKVSFANLKHPLIAEARDAAELDQLLGHLLCGEKDPQLSEKFDIHHGKHSGPVGEPGRCKIILGSNGMCAGGGIVDILSATLRDIDTTVLLTGYQSPGTPGFTLAKIAKGEVDPKPDNFVSTIGVKVTDIRATIRNIGGLYSAHADQAGLVRYCLKKDRDDRPYLPVTAILVHGDEESRDQLRETLQKWDATNKEASRGLKEIFTPPMGAGWYDCKTRTFVQDSAPGDSEKLAELTIRHAMLKAVVQRHLEGDLTAEQMRAYL
jgi:metallo-beta-lactamase family protein